MANPYSPYALYPASYPVMNQPVMQPYYTQSAAAPISYMITVDGEIGARAWQPQGNMPLSPNTVVPLWDLDGKHVFFKSTDAYGRMNPLRVGTVVFEDETIQAKSGDVSAPEQHQDMSMYITKDDFDQLKQDLRQEIKAIYSAGRNNQNRNNDRGENK